MKRTIYVGVPLVLALISAGACTSLIGGLEVAAGGSPGSTLQPTGGAGGRTSRTSSLLPTTGQGGTSQVGGSGGSGGGVTSHVECTGIADCPTPPNACVTATCTAGVCGTDNVSSGFVVATDSPADCKDTVCDGAGHTTKAVNSTNVPASTNPCLKGTCTGMNPGTTPQPARATCTDTSGSGLCDGAGTCVQCLLTSDCTNGSVCSPTYTCVPASCSDNQKDNSETDIDCGGGSCSPCAAGKKCTSTTDCVDKVCTGGICAQPGCNDGIKNGKETDTDCGGPTCPACGPNKFCSGDTDCVGKQCGGGTCTPNCSDSVQNNDETDKDCGGSCTTCANGLKCVHNTDCQSSACDATNLVCDKDQCADGHKDGNETDIDCGGGTCPTCATAKSCKQDTDCKTSACDGLSLQCVLSQCADNRKDGAETDTDCGGGGACSTCAVGKKCLTDTDCATSACDSTNLTCDSSHCGDGHKNGGETDVDCGGGTCSACAVGKGCTKDGDCTSGYCDLVKSICASDHCHDEKKDSDETDIDCGGATCTARCAIGKACSTDTDCVSPQACDANTPKLCVSDSCKDHHKNGSETDVDCGGSCTGCALAKACKIDGDCASKACDLNTLTCVSNHCNDHRLDWDESDVDCGGNDCAACGYQKKCNSTSDCAGSYVCSPTYAVCM